MLLSIDLQQIITPKELEKFVNKIVTIWKGVGLELGLKHEDINIIASDHPFSCEEACRTMLFKWQRKTLKPTFGMLIGAIERYKASSGDYQIDKCKFSIYICIEEHMQIKCMF